MSKSLTKLNVGLSGSAEGLAHGFQEAIGSLHSFAGKAMEIGSQLGEWVGIGAAVEVGRQAIDQLGEAIKSGFETADHIENTQAALIGLTGSAEAAKAMVEQLKTVASTPPFGFDEVAAASKTLLSAGVASDQVIGIIENLGDVSVGTGANLQSLTEIFARAANDGTVGTRELNEASRMGIPIVQALAKQYGTNKQGIEEMAKAGTISFTDLQSAFAAMSAEGGRFHGLAESQANTLGGVYSTLKSQIQFAFADIANAIAEAFDFKGALESVKGTLPKITDFIINAISVAAPYIQAVEKYIFGMAENVYDWISANWGGIVNVTSGTIGSVYDIFSAGFAAVSDIVKALWDSVATIWNAALNAMGVNTDKSGKDTSKSWGETAKDVVQFIDIMAARLANWRSGLTSVVSDAMVQFAKLKEWLGLGTKDADNAFRATSRAATVTNYNKKMGTNLNFEQIEAIYVKAHPGKANPYAGMHDQEHGNDVLAAMGGAEQAHADYSADVAKTLEQQQKNREKIDAIVDDVLKNGFHAKALELPKIKAPEPIKFDAKLNQDNLDLKITPKMDNKLLRYGSAEMQLASYAAPAVGAATPAPVASRGHAAPAAPPAPPQAAAATSDDPAKVMAAALQLIQKYIVKWDTNPPLATVSM